METIAHVCNTKDEIKTKIEFLDKASIVKIKIDDGGVLKDVNNLVGIYNISKGKMCCATIPYYNLIQHKEYFLGFGEALDRLNIKYTMTLQQSGNRAFCDFEFKDRNLKFEKVGEEFTTGIRLINSYDKSMGLYVIPRFTRLVCTNGMILTRCAKTFSIKHHNKAVNEIQRFIEKRLNDLITEYSDLNAWVSGAMIDSIEWRFACKILAKLFEQLKHREQILKNLGISIIEIEDKKTNKKSIGYVWDNAAIKKEKLTRWEVYNAITKYLSHGEQITPHIENMFHRKAEKLLITPLAKMPMEKEI